MKKRAVSLHVRPGMRLDVRLGMRMAGRGGCSHGGMAGGVAEPRLALVERITLAPRQSLALIEAEGRRILVATSAEGGPAFYPLDESVSRGAHAGTNRALHGRPRVSW